ncbi:MAG: 5'/3'-nucleotidase SurE [Flavobacteriales bacterium]|nr:5'/3'-nucleotidase SurE [Flavobacteriales bacterium]MCB9447717.1 5'/3'-nucleotidase SurE [Flavobacteriales bacterium]
MQDTSKRPVILVTNDDGIKAPGLRTLIRIMNEFGDVLVVAPDKPQSGMGHAITIHSPLRLQEVQINGHREYECSGTPVDCVKLAVNQLLHRKPDLCVSGINHGQNSSINVIYSGTMSAAVEGAIESIPSIGFSLLDHSVGADFSEAEDVVRQVVSQVLEHGLPEGTCLNVNIPRKSEEKLKGIKVCRQAMARYEEEFEERRDPMGIPYFWLTGVFRIQDHGEDTDEWALKNHYVSVVPVQFDMTSHHSISTLNQWDFE